MNYENRITRNDLPPNNTIAGAEDTTISTTANNHCKGAEETQLVDDTILRT